MLGSNITERRIDYIKQVVHTSWSTSLKTFKKNNKTYQDLVLLKRKNTIYVENITVIVFVFKNVQGFETFFFALAEILGFWNNNKNIFLMFSGKVFDQNIINGPVRSC